MGSRNVEGVGGILGLKANTGIGEKLPNSDVYSKHVIGADDFTKAKQLIPIPNPDDAIFEQAHPAMKIALQKVLRGFVHSYAISLAGKEWKSWEDDWKFRMRAGKEKLEYKVSLFDPVSKKPSSILTLRIGTKLVDGKKQWAVMLKKPDGTWQTFTAGSQSLRFTGDERYDWLGQVGNK